MNTDTYAEEVIRLVEEALELHERGDFPGAVELVRRARRFAVNSDGASLANVLLIDAIVRQDMGDLRGAERAVLQAVAAAGELIGSDAVRLQVRARAVLGSVRQALGRDQVGERELRSALDLAERVYGADDPELASALNDLGMIHQSQGRLAKAEQLFRRAVAILESTVHQTHPMLVLSRANHNFVRRQIGGGSTN